MSDLQPIGDALVEAEKVAGRALAMVSGTTLGNELLGTAADPLRQRRALRQLRALVEMQRLIDESGLTGTVVPDRTLFPLLEFVAREDDDDMIGRWAKLLAEAAVAGDAVPRVLMRALSQLDPIEASWLDRLHSAEKTEREFLLPVWIAGGDDLNVVRLRGLQRDELLAYASMDPFPRLAACLPKPEDLERPEFVERGVWSGEVHGEWALGPLGTELLHYLNRPVGG